jgi:hypothetical protein
LTGIPKPLIILTADKDAQFAIQELMRRTATLGIRPIEFDCFPHPEHDSGIYKRAHEFLRVFLKWDHALVVFDREGCGHDDKPPELLESAVENRLEANGWANRCRSVVIDPELEAWVWDRSCQVSKLLDWPEGAKGLRNWMAQLEFLREGSFKPDRPKEAFDAALFHRRIKHSSGLFRDLATNFNFDGCRDAAFQRFVSTLQAWFPAS